MAVYQERLINTIKRSFAGARMSIRRASRQFTEELSERTKNDLKKLDRDEADIIYNIENHWGDK